MSKMGVSANKKAETPPDPGGSGGVTPEQADPPGVTKSRSEMRTLMRAVINRWPIDPKDRADAIDLVRKRMRSKSERVSARALELMRHLEAQNMADDHLNARLQNSGLAIIEARKTIETQPDGTVKETQVMKLYGREAPLEDV